MIILNPDADEEQQQEILERVQQLIRDGGGEIDHVNDWGRRKIAYPIHKHDDGRYVVITSHRRARRARRDRARALHQRTWCCGRFFVRLNRAEAERARAAGAPAPVDTHPEGESRPPRGGRPAAAAARPAPALTGSGPCPPT